MISVRGNTQIAYSFDQQNQNGRDKVLHMNKPQIKKGTELVFDNMVRLSNLGRAIKIIHGGAIIQTKRSKVFSRSLHYKNVLEGFTVAVTDVDQISDVKCHVDQYNCRTDDYNVLCIASKLMRKGFL
jgi:hypothetical protein